MSFYKELIDIEETLKSKGFHVNIPISAQAMRKHNDFDVTHFKNVFTLKQKAEFIKKNFQKITQGDAILVINNSKNGIHGYIGANVLMEIALAFYFKKKIYIWNPIPENADYREELLAFDVAIINQQVDKITIT